MGNCYQVGGCTIKINSVKENEGRVKFKESIPNISSKNNIVKINTKKTNPYLKVKITESSNIKEKDKDNIENGGGGSTIRIKHSKSQSFANLNEKMSSQLLPINIENDLLDELDENGLKTVTAILRHKATMPTPLSPGKSRFSGQKTILPNYKKLEINQGLPVEEILRRERRNTLNKTPQVNNKLEKLNIKFGLLDNPEIENKSKKIETKVLKMMRCDINLSDDDLILIRESLSNHILFKDLLTLDIINKILEHITLIELKAETVLFSEGDNGDYFYILKKGILELTVGSTNEKITFKNGSVFGELALIQKNKRSGTVVCIENSTLFCIDGNAFREVTQRVNQSFFKERIYFLSLIPIFTGLNSIQIHDMALGMLQCDYGSEEFIIKEGEKGESLYIIKEGSVSCEKGKTPVRKLHAKDFFGELSILFETKRSLSIITKSKTICYQISKSLLIEILGPEFYDIILSGICSTALKNTKKFNVLVCDEYFKFVYRLFKLNINNNNKIIIPEEHYKDKKICIVVEGNLINSITKEVLSERGEVFEESLLESKTKLGYDVVSQSECITMEASWEAIVDKTGLAIGNKDPIKLLGLVSYIKKIKLFQNISITKLVCIGNVMDETNYLKGQVIFEDNSDGDKIYLIYSGRVKIMKDDKLVREIEEGNCFGEISLLLNEKHSATVIAASDYVVIYTLTKEFFLKFFDTKMIEILINKISLQDRFNTSLDDLYLIKKIGQGKFGSVSLVHNTKNVYAIKAVNLQMVEKNKYLIKYFQKERNILLSIDYHFIVKLIKTLKNHEYIFYLMEYVKGVTLAKHLSVRHKHKLKNRRETQFFIASLLLIVDYLNKRNIAHRDLKPDNIMVNEKGFLKLVDFGTATVIDDFTNTIIGTPHYMAPEILQRRGYSLSIDYWSIGIIMYELYFGTYPFGQNANDPMDVYREILKKDLSFPKSKSNDQTVLAFVKLLLRKKVKDRVCSLEVLKQDRFFQDFNWVNLIEMSIEPPYIPENKVNIEKILENTKTPFINNINSVRSHDYSLHSNNQEEKITENDFNPNWIDDF